MKEAKYNIAVEYSKQMKFNEFMNTINYYYDVLKANFYWLGNSLLLEINPILFIHIDSYFLFQHLVILRYLGHDEDLVLLPRDKANILRKCLYDAISLWKSNNE